MQSRCQSDAGSHHHQQQHQRVHQPSGRGVGARRACRAAQWARRAAAAACQLQILRSRRVMQVWFVVRSWTIQVLGWWVRLGAEHRFRFTRFYHLRQENFYCAVTISQDLHFPQFMRDEISILTLLPFTSRTDNMKN